MSQQIRNLDSLLTLFPSMAAEDETDILPGVFVETEVYKNSLRMVRRQPRLIVGEKGSGKSAFLRFFFQSQRDRDARVFVQPRHLQIDWPDDSSLGSLEASCHAALVRAVANSLGASVNAWSDLDAVLRDTAVESGEREQELLRRGLDALAAASGIEFPKGTVTPDIVQARRIFRAVIKHLEATKRDFYLLIDDTDKIADPSDPSYLQRLWAFLSAARALANDSPRILVAVTLRLQVWKRLAWEDAENRDQVRQFEPFVALLSPRRRDTEAIINTRIQSARRHLMGKSLPPAPHHAMWPFFDSDRARVHWEEDDDDRDQAWMELLVTQGRNPRDSVDLVHRLADRAMRTENRRDVITSDDLLNVVGAHSAACVAEVTGEYTRDCSKLARVIRSLHAVGRRFTADQIVNHLSKEIKAIPGLRLRGVELDGGSMDDVFRLWALIFECGVIIGRRHDDTAPRKFRHVFYHDDAGLIAHENWPDLKELMWEVNAVFRPFLREYRRTLGQLPRL